MPTPPTVLSLLPVVPQHAHPHATNPRLPGLNARSVRRLRHLHAVRSLRRMLVAAIAAMAVMVIASVGVPAYAQADAVAHIPSLQALTVARAATIAVAVRDGYTVTAPPPVQWPTELHTKISDGFGPRTPPCNGCSSFHEGVDFDAGWGAQVHAMAAGVVVETDSPFNNSLGNHITIQHLIGGQTVTTVYGHMQYGSTSSKVGDKVKVGQVIGLVGSTGASTGPHLHFEVRVDGTPVNPLTWMRAHVG